MSTSSSSSSSNDPINLTNSSASRSSTTTNTDELFDLLNNIKADESTIPEAIIDSILDINDLNKENYLASSPFRKI